MESVAIATARYERGYHRKRLHNVYLVPVVIEKRADRVIRYHWVDSSGLNVGPFKHPHKALAMIEYAMQDPRFNDIAISLRVASWLKRPVALSIAQQILANCHRQRDAIEGVTI